MGIHVPVSMKLRLLLQRDYGKVTPQGQAFSAWYVALVNCNTELEGNTIRPTFTLPDLSSEVCWKHTGWTMEVINKTLVQTRDSN